MVRSEEKIQERIDIILHVEKLLSEFSAEKSAGVLIGEILVKQFPYLNNIPELLKNPERLIAELRREIFILEWVLCKKEF
jgi:hypothetical protein